MKSSWKTSLCGGIAVVATALGSFLPAPYAQIANGTATIATALGLFFARDNDKSSEQVGAGNTGGK